MDVVMTQGMAQEDRVAETSIRGQSVATAMTVPVVFAVATVQNRAWIYRLIVAVTFLLLAAMCADVAADAKLVLADNAATKSREVATKRSVVKPVYQVVWGPNEPMCEHMASLVNANLHPGGYLNYKARDRIESVTWKEVRRRFPAQGDLEQFGLTSYYVTNVDINNDGHNELVLLENEILNWRTGSLPVDVLTLLDRDYFTDPGSFSDPRSGGYIPPEVYVTQLPHIDLTFGVREELRVNELPGDVRKRFGIPVAPFNPAVGEPHIFIVQYEHTNYLLLQNMFLKEGAHVRLAGDWILAARFLDEFTELRSGKKQTKLAHECYLWPKYPDK